MSSSEQGLLVLPFTRIAYETVVALNATGREVTRIDVSASDESYYLLMNRLWKTGADFAICEQDIIPTPTIYDDFDACESVWCAACYPYLTGLYAGLGCVRFRGELTGAHPGVVERAGAHSFGGHPLRHWCVLDAGIQWELRAIGLHPCTHGQVGTTSTWPSHGCHGPEPRHLTAV